MSAAPILLALCVSLFSAPGARAADEPQVLRARAAQLATNDECPKALPLLARAARLDPAGADSVALLEGRCRLSVGDFDAATPLLEKAAKADPNSGEAAIALGMSRYHQGKLDAARSELERAERMLPNRPEPPLYLGLILLDRDEATAAADQFDRSGRLGGDGFEAISTYYAALARANAGEAERARESLLRVEEIAPGTPYAARAREAREAAEARRRSGGDLRRWVTLQSGIDYDTNVSVKSDAIGRPTSIENSNEDGRVWWGIDLGADLFKKNGWGLGTGVNYTGNAYFSESNFNQQFLTGSFWLDRALGENTSLRIAPEGGVGLLDESEFLRFAGVRPEIRHDFGSAGIGSLYARYAYNDFRYDRENPRLDRDGHDLRAGYNHSLPVGETTTLRGGVFGRHFISEGTEWDHTGGGGWLGFSQALPWKLVLDVSGSAAYDVYDDESRFVSVPGQVNGQEREDLIGTASAVLTRPITDWLSVSARWNYFNSDSNTPVFDYDRHVVGAFFTIGFAQPGGLFWGNNS